MQKEMATIEQVAQDNHERARRLMKELNQMQHEYTELKQQVCTWARLATRDGGLRHAHAPLGADRFCFLNSSLKRTISLGKL